MNALEQIKSRFEPVLSKMSDTDVGPLLEMIKPAQDNRFGDYQINSAMSLSKRLSSEYEGLKSPREVAAKTLEMVEIDDFCKNAEVAGPGFINLTLDDQWIKGKLGQALGDDRLAVAPTANPKTVVIDFSSPNVAKPMHVGHIRSTVIGDSLAKILRFAGHKVITDNHLGAWGTQFGMIIYGYKHFVDKSAYDKSPIDELLRLYRLVRQIIDFHKNKNETIPKLQAELVTLGDKLAELEAAEKPADKSAAKKQKKDIGSLKKKIGEIKLELDGDDKSEGLLLKVEKVERDEPTLELFNQHTETGKQVLQETVKLHQGDEENVGLWKEFMPVCLQDIQRIYDRLSVEFDHSYGESFYHEMLADVVESLEQKQIAAESQGATCVFLDQFETPMIVRKKDGAFLYSTTDLATIKYRMDHWQPDTALYVVDHRQHEHFSKLFAVAEKWGYSEIDLRHISFGTILGKDGKPFKTRDGDTVGLEGLINDAVLHARKVVNEVDRDNNLGEDQRAAVSEVVGVGALKYADLSQNRTSDYKFDFEKMVALKGNTATYLQYCYARVQGVFRKCETDGETVRANSGDFTFEQEIERQLALKLCQFGEAVDEVLVDFKPNLLAQYLYELTDTFFKFYDQCPVKDAESALQQSRLQLCDLVARTIEQGLSMLGIGVVERM